MVLMTVVVPDGLLAGDEMTVEATDGQQFNVTVPHGCRGGSSIEVDLPASERTDTEQLEVVVPAGTHEGETFNVETAWGGVFEIAVPTGCGPGDAILVDLPLPPPDATPPAPAPAAAPSPSPAAAPAEADGGFKFKPGQRVELERSDGAMSPGTIMSAFQGVFDVMYRVQLDNGLYKEAVPEEEISEATCDVGSLFDEW